MRAAAILFLSISASSICGCANRVFYDTPGLISGTYEFAEVVEVELVEPPRYRCSAYRNHYGSSDLDWYISASRCRPTGGWGDTERKLRGERTDAVAARGSALVIDLESGWTIQTTVLREDGDEIRVVSSRDIGLVPGDRVRLGFRRLPPAFRSDRVALSRPSDDLLDPQAKANLSTSNAARILQTALVDRITETEQQTLTRAQRDVLQTLGILFLRSLEEEFIDVTYGVRSENQLLRTIQPILDEANLRLAIVLAWDEYESRAIPEFSVWIAANALGD